MARPPSRLRDVYVRIDGVMRKIPGVQAVLSDDDFIASEIMFFDTRKTEPLRLATGEVIQVSPRLDLVALREE